MALSAPDPVEFSALTALSPLDGRYRKKVASLNEYFSEFAFFRYRARIELAWLEALSDEAAVVEVPPLSGEVRARFRRIITEFDAGDAQQIKDIERKTNHDVKALEYWLRKQLEGVSELASALEFIHFACTSEDINNLSHAMMLADARRDVLLPALRDIGTRLKEIAHRYAELPMLGRTHGQPATPTTLGKEIANFVARLSDEIARIEACELRGKINGAVGNYNAHVLAYPDVDWELVARRFVESFGIHFNSYTTQIEPHDYMVVLFDAFARANSILIDLNRDLWNYISIGYFKQKLREDHVGSSTMPHKVNPINFENSEGNLGLANALLRHFSEKLPISRWQRDLTDSTVLRNMGVAFGYSLLGYVSCCQGLEELDVDADRLAADLESNWEVLAEPIQTVMRRYGVADAYEQLKALTRGSRGITREKMREFIETLAVPEEAKARLRALTPAGYIGRAAELAKRIQ